MQLPAVEFHADPVTGSEVRDTVQPRGDRLTARVESDDRVRTERFDAARTSDYVPILVGGVLAFMSLVVFGAAASFVSLR